MNTNDHAAVTLRPLLHEIHHALQRLAQAGEEHTIDLEALPFGPGDEALLLEFLGEGEVVAGIHALGESQVLESRFPGVWLVTHFSEEGVRLAQQLEITRTPALLRTPQEELDVAVEQFAQALREQGGADDV